MLFCFFFFFQAEDGIRDLYVTGVQTCALPISRAFRCGVGGSAAEALRRGVGRRRQRAALSARTRPARSPLPPARALRGPAAALRRRTAGRPEACQGAPPYRTGPARD